jgi:hypothetical protein
MGHGNLTLRVGWTLGHQESKIMLKPCSFSPSGRDGFDQNQESLAKTIQIPLERNLRNPWDDWVRGPWAYSWGDEATCNLLHPSMHGEIESFELREDFKENEKGISWAHQIMELEVRIFIFSLRCWSLVTPWSSFLSLLSLLSCSSSFLLLHLRKRAWVRDERVSRWGLVQYMRIFISSRQIGPQGWGEG